MSDLPNGWQTLVGGLHKKNDVGGNLITRETAGLGKVPRVRDILGGGVPGGIFPCPAWDELGHSVGDPPPIAQAI